MAVATRGLDPQFNNMICLAQYSIKIAVGDKVPSTCRKAFQEVALRYTKIPNSIDPQLQLLQQSREGYIGHTIDDIFNVLFAR
jgi:hypothetical protein